MIVMNNLHDSHHDVVVKAEEAAAGPQVSQIY